MKFDLVVCGAGPAGAAAAITAARNGLKVCLVERDGGAGGMATSALVNPWMGHWFWDPAKKQWLSLGGGFFSEIVRGMREMNAVGAALNSAAFDEERLKCLYDRLLREAGVEVLFHALVTGVRRRGRRLERVVVDGKGGRREISAAYFIDATGDGDVADFAGCTASVGRPQDGLSQAMTLSFRLANVDKAPLLATGDLAKARALVDSYFQDARANGTLDYPYRDFIHFYDYPRPGVLHFNMTRINQVSGLSLEDLTRAEMEGRRQAALISDWLIRSVPYFRDAYLMKLAAHVGVRETRHVEGRYVMTHADVAAGRKFPDGIARSAYIIDIHSPVGSGFDHEVKGTKGEAKQSYAPPAGDYYEVPFRSLVPLAVDNLLVACRALSASHEASAAVRVMATMMAVGEAAGLAAGLACAKKTVFPELDGEAVRARLPYLDHAPQEF